MAIGTYELWLDHWDGTRLAYLDSMLKLEYTRTLGNVGVINLTMPSTFDTSLLQDDYKIEVHRALPGVPKRRENVYMIRAWRKWTDDAGVNKTMISGVDGNDILKRRIVYANAGTPWARKTGYAGNILRQYVRDCMAVGVWSTPTNNNGNWDERANIATYFTVQADANDGNNPVTENREWQTLFDTANGVCSRSTGRGDALHWYVYPVSGAEYQFRCYAPLMGQDLTGQFVVTVDNAMAEAVHEYDATEEFTMFVTIGGIYNSDTGFRFEYSTTKNPRLGATPFCYRERVSHEGTETGAEAPTDLHVFSDDEAGSDEFAQQETFTAKFMETEDRRYGRDWDLGDKIKFSYRGVQKDAVVTTVYASLGNTEEIYSQFKLTVQQDTEY